MKPQMELRRHELRSQTQDPRYLKLLNKWFWREMRDLYGWSRPSWPQKVLMGCPVWGEEFIDRFFRFVVPTLKTEANLRALAGNAHLVLFTDAAGFVRLGNFARDLEWFGITVQVCTIPESVMEMVNDRRRWRLWPLDKYWLLGTTNNLMLQMAARYKTAFHMLQPDHVYCGDYFANLFRLSKDHPAVIQGGISADLVGVVPELKRHLKPIMGGVVDIPARDLITMGWKHLHPQTRDNLMNHGNVALEDYPFVHQTVWQARDRIVMYNAHMNPAWLSREICAEAPILLYNTADTELPRLIPDFGQAYVAGEKDGLAFIEVSDGAKLGNGRIDADRWHWECWGTVHFLDLHMPYFEVPCSFPIEPQAEGLDVEEIARRQADMTAELKAAKPEMVRRYEELPKRRAA